MLVSVASVSGGKDSTVTAKLAEEWSQRTGKPVRRVFADTGHEHPTTVEYVQTLHDRIGGPPVEIIQADLTDCFEPRRQYIAEHWPADGVPDEVVKRALELLQPTGSPFWDLALIKGRFPSRRAQFCTSTLKVAPMAELVNIPLMEQGHTVVSWQGVRRDESDARRDLPKLQRLFPSIREPGVATVKVSEKEYPGRYYAFRPILEWTRADVFKFLARHGSAANALYGDGFSRVGCAPCVNEDKAGIRLWAMVYPWIIDRVREMERICSLVSKRGSATFFAVKKKDIIARETPGPIHYLTHGIDRQVEWSRTQHGGVDEDRQFMLDVGTECAAWGACE